MNKTEIQNIAKDAFKKDPSQEKVFITSDGHPFFSSNAANLHKNTNPQKKKLTVITVVNEAFGASEGKKEKKSKTKDNVKKLSEMKTEELKKVAEGLVDISKAKNNKERVTLIEAAQAKVKANNELIAKLPQMKEADLKVLAEGKGIRPDEGADKQAIIELIEGLLKAEIKE